MECPIGIHLGTNNCVVAVRGRRVEVIANDTGSRSTPCVVGFQDGKRYVGEAAKDLPPFCTVFVVPPDIKRLIGREFNDPEIKAGMDHWPFAVLNEEGKVLIEVQSGEQGTQRFSPEEAMGYIFSEIKKTAEVYLPHTVKESTVTVPYYFGERQLKAIKDAGQLAGLEVTLVSEPRAAVVAYGLDKKDSGLVLVLHLGAGTCEVSVLRVQAGKCMVLASRADLHLGGNDFDTKLVEHFSKDIDERCRMRVAEDPKCLRELRQVCESARIKLSCRSSVKIKLNSMIYESKIFLRNLEKLCDGLIERVLGLCEQVLADAKVEKGALGEVVLVGGVTCMPRLRTLLKQRLGSSLRTTCVPHEVLARGAAMHAASLSAGAAGKEVELQQGDEEEEPPRTSTATPAPSKAASSRQQHKPSEGPPIGIDLGTTFSVVAVHRKGRVDVMINESGKRITPSVVGFEDGRRYVGDAAEDLPATKKVFDVKRLIGRNFRDPNVQADMKRWPFTVVDRLGAPRLQTNVNGKDEEFSPEEISAMILSYLKDCAEATLSLSVKKAVITVPAYFDETQRQATKDAGVIAGLEVIGMINEPTAACIAYGLNCEQNNKTIVIYDLGGGTFDVSVMKIVNNEFRVLASGGDTHLGGQDFNMRLFDHFSKDITTKHPGLDVSKDPQSLQNLRTACEIIKKKLSNVAEHSCPVYFPRQDVSYKATASRALFEDMCYDLFKKTIDITQQVLADAHVQGSAVDDVVLVGGSTRIPKVRSMLQAFFGGKELKHSINPDEAVAYGAAVHAAALGGDRVLANQVVLRDVTPLSLGVATLGDIFDTIVPRNSQVPCRKSKSFRPAVDYQVEVWVEVFQGERQFAKDNKFLKCFQIDVPRKPWAEVNLDVTFDIDANGLLTVSCTEASTGETRKITVTQNDARLNDEEIQKMIKNSIRFKDDDEKQKERVQEMLRNNLMF